MLPLPRAYVQSLNTNVYLSSCLLIGTPTVTFDQAHVTRPEARQCCAIPMIVTIYRGIKAQDSTIADDADVTIYRDSHESHDTIERQRDRKC